MLFLLFGHHWRIPYLPPFKTSTRSSIKASHDTFHPMPRVYHIHLCYTNQNISLSPNFGVRNLIQTKQMMQIGHPKIVSLNGPNSLVGDQSSNESAFASTNQPHDGHLCRTTSSATLSVLQGKEAQSQGQKSSRSSATKKEWPLHQSTGLHCAADPVTGKGSVE